MKVNGNDPTFARYTVEYGEMVQKEGSNIPIRLEASK